MKSGGLDNEALTRKRSENITPITISDQSPRQISDNDSSHSYNEYNQRHVKKMKPKYIS